MEVVETSLHYTLPCSPGIFFSFTYSLSLSHKHTSILAYVYIIHFPFMFNVNPGNFLTSPPDDHSLNCSSNSVFPFFPLFFPPVPFCLPFC